MRKRKVTTSRRFTLCRVLSALLFCGSAAANADSVEDFYRGKTVNFEIGDAPGGGYDIYAHFVARFLGAHIPGNPVVVARNMPGAGSRTAAGYVYKVAAPDGLTIGASEEALPLEQAVGDETIPFDTAKLNWIGSPDSDNKVVVTWFTSGVKTIEDAKNREVQMGASADTTSSQYMNAMNALIGTRFKIVYGYPGGGDINLAMERGEVAGRGSSSWATWKAKPEVLRDHKINVLVQIGFDKASGLEDVPLLIDLGGNADDREIFKLLSAPTAIGHPIFTSPGVPPERVNALRDAFDATMRDPAFIDEARKLKLDVQPTQGQKLQQIVADILSAPKPIRDRLAPIIITRTQSKTP
ncbi:MAG TPA: tripartite tricarboxylate transporter substrate-binding protein [Beijerinckiaceae bacterium]|nr:tripartite tricarboxylate transporter substrate-binding protein [Beijerinckiaceae bacterium]